LSHKSLAGVLGVFGKRVLVLGRFIEIPLSAGKNHGAFSFLDEYMKPHLSGKDKLRALFVQNEAIATKI